jgi:hypothetical protein
MGNRRWRIVATAETVEGDAPSLDVVNAVLAKRGPQGFRAESPVWTSYFTIHHRCVSQMSSGRVFVCGDAAHIHSPYGGQGMNTGLQDAWNLAWKLDVTLRGFATDALLASYSGERHPIVLGVIATTDRLTKAMTMHNPLAVDVRNAILPILTHIPMFQRAFTERMSGLGNAYEGSPIVAGGGKRYLDDSLRGGKGVGRRFILVVPRDDAATTSEANNLASQFPEVLEVRLDGAGDVRLVRPDGYLAYEGPSRPNSLTHVEEVLRRQVRTTSSVSS